MPSIIFEVNLETVKRLSSNLPVAPTDSVDNFRTTRSTWFPDLGLDNRKLKHGDRFTLTGKQAMYFKNNFVTGDDAFLKIITETPDA